MLTVKISGIDRTNRVSFDGSFSVKDNVNQQRDTMDFTVKKNPSQSFFELKGEEIVVEFGDTPTRVFGGIITSTNQKVESANQVIYECQAVDFSFELDRKLVLERITNKTVAEIIEDLATVYAPSFTFTGVNCDYLVESIIFNRIKISECLQKLAEMTGYVWYVDAYKDIHFFPRNDELAPFSLSDTSENYLWESLQISDDLSQIRNSIFVEGGEVEGNSTSEEFTASGTADERTYFRLAHKFSGLPTVTVGGVSKTVGIDYLNSDSDFQCMWDYAQKYVRFTTGNIPAASAVISVTGIPLYKLIGKMNNSESILNHGEWEFAIRDNTIRNQDSLRERALAELEAYKNGVVEGSFITYNPGLRSGQVITINSDIRGINESFLIQSVSFSMRSPTSDGMWNVRLATLRTVGIIEFLQRILRDNRQSTTTSDAEFLLSFYQFDDSADADDALGSITTTSPPYKWEDTPATPQTNPIRWNKFTWG